MKPEQLPFSESDILIPKKNHEKWASIACDQFTSDAEYWRQAKEFAGSCPSSLHAVLPEFYLKGKSSDFINEQINKINQTMYRYLDMDLFDTFRNAMIYIERTLPDGSVRRGIAGKIDLECYDFHPGSNSVIRATEGTVADRIPPRVNIRRKAPFEMPHVMMLIDDIEKTVIEPCADEDKITVYDFDLMMGGGHLKGYLLPKNSEERIVQALCALAEKRGFLFAAGDGNHSLAAAKTCYEQNKTERNRYTLAEIVNIRDDALEFEPIYRVLKNTDPEKVIRELKKCFGSSCGIPVEYLSGNRSGTIYMPQENCVPVGTLQKFLDEYIKNNPSSDIDYIHGRDSLTELSRHEGCVGFLFDGIKKSELFDAVSEYGPLPRKTFSMGEAKSKRYYMEARLIDPA